MKQLSLALTLALLLTSCGGASTPTETTSAPETTPAETTPEVPVQDLGGKTFTFYTRWLTDGWDWNVNDIYAETENGEPVNDAVYKRNAKICDLYNCNIAQLYSNTDWNVPDAETSILAGDDAFDMLIIPGRASAKFASNGYLNDLSVLESLDLTKDYRNPTVVDELTLGGKVYFAMGDLSATDNRAVRCVYFNKDIAEDNHLGNFYDLVKSGKWTQEYMFGLISENSRDLDGDGSLGEDDQYGFMGQPTVAIDRFFASGLKFTQKGSDGMLESAIKGSQAVDVLQTISERFERASESMVINWDYLDQKARFTENKSLFYAEVSLFIEHFRKYDVNVGMLPMPKFDESQEGYRQFADAGCLNYVSIPITNKSPEDSALLLEALSCESAKVLTPAYYDVCLVGKSIRDYESEEMLDLIFGSYAIEWADFYDLASLTSIRTAVQEGREIGSTLASMSDRFDSELESVNADFAK